MNKKSVLLFISQFAIAIVLTYVTLSLYNYFFSKKEQSTVVELQRGQSFTAPSETFISRPINREIDFIDSKKYHQEEITAVKTDWGTATFSSHGGIMQRLEFDRQVDGKESFITTLYPPLPEEKEHRCFLVALDRSTPFVYQLQHVNEGDASIEVIYKASFDDGSIRKRFVIHRHLYKIDVEVDVRCNDPVQLRMLFPSPEMVDIKEKDSISAFSLEDKKIMRFDQASLPLNKYWKMPTLIGTTNRYFVHSLIADDNQMIDRAYFSEAPDEKIWCWIESKETTQKEGCKYSFYFGPKDTDDVRPVDTRLEEMVDYSGFFGPISMLMLKILKYLNRYFGNFGLAIVIVTLLMRIVMFPFSLGTKQQSKKKLEMDKKLKHLQQKYRDNPQRFQQERYELIRKQGFGGMGMGCLMPLIQIPFFIGLNRLLSTSIELYKAPFISGWINDLSAPDPYYILPVMFAVGMLLTALQSPKEQRTTFMVIGVGGAALFSSFASGLMLFFVVSMLAGLVSTYIANKYKLA